MLIVLDDTKEVHTVKYRGSTWYPDNDYHRLRVKMAEIVTGVSQETKSFVEARTLSVEMLWESTEYHRKKKRHTDVAAKGKMETVTQQSRLSHELIEELKLDTGPPFMRMSLLTRERHEDLWARIDRAIGSNRQS